jgi:uncharacterized protein (TIGR02596 family)
MIVDFYRRDSSKSHGFSLVELLVVMAIIGLLGVLVSSSFSSIRGGHSVTEATSAAASVLREAAQESVVRNEVTAVRFYQIKDPNFPASNLAYRAMQVWRMGDDGQFQPLSRPKLLGKNVAVFELDGSSPLLSKTIAGISSGTEPRVASWGTNVPYKEIRFYPNRQTSIATPSNSTAEDAYFTIAEDKPGVTSLPANFAMLVIEPMNGKLRIFRP